MNGEDRTGEARPVAETTTGGTAGAGGAAGDDAPPPAEDDRDRRRYPRRTCIVTRRVLPREALLRFVLGPGDEVVFDPDADLPGRGAWLVPGAGVLAEAVRRNAFARAFRRRVVVSPDLPRRVREELRRRLLATLSMARKAGAATSGFDRVGEWIDRGRVAVLVEAADGAADGRRKLLARLRRAGGEAEMVDLLDSEQLGLAFGRPNVIHAALEDGGLARKFLKLARLIRALDDGETDARNAGTRSEQSGR